MKKIKLNQIIQGDALKILKTLPSESVNCIVTSPPYWALRDYGVKGQLGLESTFEKYTTKLCDIFDEVKRVLRKDGTCWVNIGDTYYTKSGSGFENDNISKDNKGKGILKANELRGRPHRYMQSKSLVGIPMRFALEMINRGWILRNEIIWYKPNCMPSSASDRFTVDFEKIFFFTKSKKYWFEQQFDKSIDPESFTGRRRRNPESMMKVDKKNYAKAGSFDKDGNDRGVGKIYVERNKRAVWKITTKGYKEAHFATFPEKLIETPILAGCPEKVCKKCGKPREEIYNSLGNKDYSNNSNYKRQIDTKHNLEKFNRNSRNMETTNKEYLGLSDCGCNAGFESGIVIDLFMGSGTTALGALKQGKKFIGIELNPKYIKIAEDRIEGALRQKRLL